MSQGVLQQNTHMDTHGNSPAGSYAYDVDAEHAYSTATDTCSATICSLMHVVNHVWNDSVLLWASKKQTCFGVLISGIFLRIAF